MGTPNAQLESAMAQFAEQPGATLEQVAQLRAAITADAGRLAQFNQQATSGRRRRFVQEVSGDEPTLVETYDKAAGAVTLPVAAFTAGAGAGGDLKALLGVQEMPVTAARRICRKLPDMANELCRVPGSA